MRAAWRVAAVCAPLLWLVASGCGRDALVYGNLGDACFEDAQCQEGLACASGVCELLDEEEQPDMGGADVPDSCEPGQTTCLDESTVGLCLGGQDYEVLEFCQGACQDGACTQQPGCEEGQRRCRGSFTVQVCRDGLFEDTLECSREEPCQAGRCVASEEVWDIEASDVSLRPTSVAPGDTATVNFQVAAEGPDVLFNVDCGIYMIPRQQRPRPATDTLIGALSLDALGPGERFLGGARVRIPDSARPGRRQVYVYCDRFDAYPEADEENNISVAGEDLVITQETQGLADLEVLEVFLEADVLRQGEQAPVYMVLCNNGESDARDFQVNVEAYSPVDPRVNFSVGRSIVPVLDAGDCIDYSFLSGPWTCPGDNLEPLWILRAEVDSAQDVRESNEDNNIIEIPQPFGVECDTEVCLGDRFDFEDAGSPPLISPGSYDLQLCQGDIDRFAIRLEAGDVLRGSLVRLDGGGDTILECNFTSQASTGLYRERWIDALDFETIPVPWSEVYTFQVRAITEDPEDVMYNMTFEILREGEALPELVPIGLSLSSIPLEDGASQIAYSFQALNTSTVGVTQDSQIYVELLETRTGRLLERRNETLSAAPGGTAVPFEGVFSLPLEGGEYAMRVRLDAEDEVREINEANNTAVARITLDDARCDEDDLEPNDSFEEALPLEPGLYEDLRACSTSGGDYYRLCPPQDAEAIVIDLSFEHGRGDIDMVLFNEDRRRVASSTGVSDAESITYDDLRGGCYQLRVFVLGGRASVTNSYDMEIEYQLSDVEPPVCDDLSEPNNNFLASFPLEELPDEPQLTFCPATDVDFFSVELDEGDTFSLTAQALEMLPGDISLIVYDPSLNFVTTASGSSPTLAFDVEEGGEHYLSVSTTSQADAFPYTLSWSASQQP